MAQDLPGLQSLTQLAPLGQGGLYDHSLPIKLNQPPLPGKSTQNVGIVSSINYAKGTMGFELFQDFSVSELKTDSIYAINDNDEINLSSSDSDDEPGKLRKTQSQMMQRNLLKKTQKLVKAISKIEKFRYENNMLRQEMDNLSDLVTKWLQEKDGLIFRIKELEGIIEYLKYDSSSRTVQLENQIDQMKKEYSEILQKLTEEKTSFKKDVDQEMKVHETIRERQEDYIAVLKKELILARNIIRTPALLEQTFKKLNFDDVEFYRHELVKKEPNPETVKLDPKNQNH